MTRLVGDQWDLFSAEKYETLETGSFCVTRLRHQRESPRDELSDCRLEWSLYGSASVQPQS